MIQKTTRATGSLDVPGKNEKTRTRTSCKEAVKVVGGMRCGVGALERVAGEWKVVGNAQECLQIGRVLH